MRARLISLFLLAAAGLLSHSTANADILRCHDANGGTLYTDSACPSGTRAVGATSLPQACAAGDCERRRERDIEEAHERLRAEKEQLAAYTAERHKRELEDRWLDEARYEAELRSAAAMQAASDQAVYPIYPLIGFPARCGIHCLTLPRHHRFPVSAAGEFGHSQHHWQGSGNSRAVRVGDVQRRTLRAIKNQ
jgi:hypothetical protein